MKSKLQLILFATSFAIVFTGLIYIVPKYDKLWLSLEVIILPIIYSIGYEALMEKQRNRMINIHTKISRKILKLEVENCILKTKK